jgi:hypothetical protein
VIGSVCVGLWRESRESARRALLTVTGANRHGAAMNKAACNRFFGISREIICA